MIMSTSTANLKYALSKLQTNETAALLRSWKKTLVGIRVNVSEVYVTFCVPAAK